MKKLLGIVVLGLLLSLSAKADDIRDFQIEGISVDDNLLDHTAILNVTKNFIKNKKNLIYPKSNKFVGIGFKYKSEKYDGISFLIDPKTFRIVSVSGMVRVENKNQKITY